MSPFSDNQNVIALEITMDKTFFLSIYKKITKTNLLYKIAK